jgi:hypothetical protein
MPDSRNLVGASAGSSPIVTGVVPCGICASFASHPRHISSFPVRIQQAGGAFVFTVELQFVGMPPGLFLSRNSQ